MKKIIKNKYIVTTFLCILIYILYLILMKIYPFGEYSILKSDLYQQYVNFFCYLKEVIKNGKSIVISWNLGLANNFYTTFAYYLICPLNILVVFFNPSNMDIFVEIITLIKIILMANFMILFLEKSYNYKNMEVILFGLIYAYSSYVICYSFHIMWLDCLYMLPIVLLFVDKFIKDNKIWPLILSLSYAILTNYYIGYIVSIFTVIYYGLKIFYKKDRPQKKRTVPKKKGPSPIVKFLLAIIISFLIGMIVILPSIIQLKGKINASSIELIKIDTLKIKLFVNILFNNYVYMFAQKSCFMFSSTLIIVLLPMFYLNRKISRREKIGFTIIIAFLLLPIISPFFNKLWHCFTIPNCFNYRYSFTLIFTTILMGAREFQNREYTEKWHFLVSLLVFSILTIIETIFLKKGYLQSDNYTVEMSSIIVSCAVYFIMLGIVYILFLSEKNVISWIHPNNHVIIKIFLTIIVITDLLIGAKSGQNNNDKYFKRDIVVQHDEFMSHFLPKLQNPETERIIFEPDEYGNNMSLKYGYSNIGFFTSARNRNTLKSMYKLGYNVQMEEQLWITSFSGTFLNYSIAGVKYYISKVPRQIYGFELEEKYKDYYVYKNKNYFNMGYYLKDNINQNDNPFIMQNDFLNKLTNNEQNVEKSYFESIEDTAALRFQQLKKSDDTTKYIVKANKDCSIYLQSDNKLQLYINNEPQFKDYSNIWSTETGIKQIKDLKKDETLEFTIEAKHKPKIYVSDNKKIQQTLDMSKNNVFINTKINKNGLTGKAFFKNDGYLVFSIAYDDCWKIYVDGKEVNKEAIAGCFLGTKIEKGEHNIEIKSHVIFK